MSAFFNAIFGGNEAPQPPSATANIGAQTSANVSTAVANSFLNNLNQETPFGSLRYDVTGSQSWTDPTTGQTYNIPTQTVTQSLSPTQRAINAQTEGAKYNLAGIANAETSSIGNLLSNSIDLSGARPAGDPNNINIGNNSVLTAFGNTGLAGAQQQGGIDYNNPLIYQYGDVGGVQRDYGPGDFSGDRARVEQSLFARAQPQLDIQQEQLRQQLADQGIRYGSPAYTAAMDNYNRQLNDLRLDIIAKGGQEQQLQAGLANQRGQFVNAAQAQAYAQEQARANFYNQMQLQGFGEAQSRAQAYNAAQTAAYQQALGRGTFANAGALQYLQANQAQFAAANQARQQYLQEQYALRNQPLNEIGALLSGGQVQMPQFVTPQASQIPTTDVAGLINQQFQQQFANYQAQLQQQNQILGGSLQAAGNIGLGLLKSDRRAKTDIHRIGTVFATEDHAGEDSERRKLPIYKYAYKGDPMSTQHVGPMAQDVEKIDPRAVVKDRRGTRYLDQPRIMGNILSTRAA